MNQPTKTMTVQVNTSEANGRALLAPMGLATPHNSLTRFAVQGAQPMTITEATTGQNAALIPFEALADRETISFVYDYSAAPTLYPKKMFEPRDSKYTRAARALIHEVQNLPRVAQGGLAAIEAIMEHTAQSFSYGHPDTRFNDGLDEVPHLGCGVTQGSCVDINTYLIAALRAGEIEAGYVTGGFFPAEKHGVCDDMHCWVVTRHNNKTLEWDIAHHLKMGTRNIAPGLNPKPGQRVALSHSMGLTFPDLGLREIKLLAEPLWVGLDGTAEQSVPEIQLAQPI